MRNQTRQESAQKPLYNSNKAHGPGLQITTFKFRSDKPENYYLSATTHHEGTEYDTLYQHCISTLYHKHQNGSWHDGTDEEMLSSGSWHDGTDHDMVRSVSSHFGTDVDMLSAGSWHVKDETSHAWVHRLVTEPVVSGGQFLSWDFEQFLNQLNIKHSKSALYHHQSNGAVDRFNRALKEGLRAKRLEGRTLEDSLRFILANYRTTVQATTGRTPPELMLGRRIRMPLDLLLLTPSRRTVRFHQPFQDP